MSEPTRTARDVEEVLPGLYHYSVEDDRIDAESDAYVLAADGRLVLVDPLPLEPLRLERLGAVVAIVIAVAGHQRSAWRWRRLTRAPVFAPRDAGPLEEAPDDRFGEDERLPGDLRPIHAPGPCDTHHVLYHASGPGVLFLADLVLRGGEGRIGFLPDEHASDPAGIRRSIRRLLEFRFDALCFGHGRPIVHGGRRALEDLLRRDSRSGD